MREVLVRNHQEALEGKKCTKALPAVNGNLLGRNVRARIRRLNNYKGGLSMDFKVFDLHNHTKASDGRHTPEEIIENAIKNKIDVIGISDHFNKNSSQSIGNEELTSYIERMKALKEKYQKHIKVLIGVEISMNKIIAKDFELPFDRLNNLDYVLFEHVGYVSGAEYLDRYSIRLEELAQYTSQLTCQKAICHTDPFEIIGTCFSDKSFNNKLEGFVSFLSVNKINLELNVNPGYEYSEFIMNNPDNRRVKALLQKLKEKGVKLTVGSDIHTLLSFDIEKVIEANRIAAMINY
jgi:HisJ family histidinol phosphate phosphatase